MFPVAIILWAIDCSYEDVYYCTYCEKPFPINSDHKSRDNSSLVYRSNSIKKSEKLYFEPKSKSLKN